MKAIHTTLPIVAILALLGLATGSSAAQLKQTYDFALDKWQPIEDSDGPVTMHRVRLDIVEGRLTKSAVTRPYNQEFLETVRVQLEYTNESSSKWKGRITVRWLDEDGKAIDGISANETFDKRSAKKINQVSLSTLKYGLERAKTLEVEIHYEP